MRIAFALLVAAALGPLVGPWSAAAGAWPRGAGQVFLSYGATLSVPRAGLAPGATAKRDHSILAETGLTARLTFGLDLHRTAGAGYGTAQAFLRYSRPLTGGHVIALDAGAALRQRPGRPDEGALRLGLGWGKGTSTRWGDGWAGLDGQATWGLDSGRWEAKLDATAGLKPTDRTMLILQLQGSRAAGAVPYLRGTGSVVRRLSPRLALEAGLSAGLVNTDEIGVILGTWLEF